MGFGKTGLRAAVAVLSLAGAGARAEQMVLFDVTYTHTSANNAHFDIRNLNQPSNWTSPINYKDGELHFYVEVFDKPTNATTVVESCFISTGYGCVSAAPRYTTPGTYTILRKMNVPSQWYQHSQIDWTKPMKLIQIIVKDVNNVNGGRPSTDYLPSKLRYVATIVSPGSTYVPPVPTGTPPPDAGTPDAGTPDASTPVTDAGTPDASTPDASTGTKPEQLDGSVPTTTKEPLGEMGGCSTGGGGAPALFALLLGATLLRRRRQP